MMPKLTVILEVAFKPRQHNHLSTYSYYKLIEHGMFKIVLFHVKSIGYVLIYSSAKKLDANKTKITGVATFYYFSLSTSKFHI